MIETVGIFLLVIFIIGIVAALNKLEHRTAEIEVIQKEKNLDDSYVASELHNIHCNINDLSEACIDMAKVVSPEITNAVLNYRRDFDPEGKIEKARDKGFDFLADSNFKKRKMH